MPTRLSPHAAPHSQGRTYWLALTRATPLVALVHLALAAMFAALGSPAMTWVNLGSVVVWGLIYMLLRRHHNLLAVILIGIEVPTQAVLATLTIGLEAGFPLFLLVAMPLVFVSPARQWRLKLLLGAEVMLVYLGLDWYASTQGPSMPIDAQMRHGLRLFNGLVTLLLLGYLAHGYQGVVGRAEKRLRELATTDVLTGLTNRRRILELAAYEMSRRLREREPLCFVVADADHFKAINDRWGHDTGDQVLTQLAQVLSSSVRTSDTVARWGGEEFLVLLPRTDLIAALQVCERARLALRSIDPLTLPTGLQITMTFGVSALRDGERLESAIARADAALYRGKAAGRNCVMADEAA